MVVLSLVEVRFIKALCITTSMVMGRMSEGLFCIGASRHNTDPCYGIPSTPPHLSCSPNGECIHSVEGPYLPLGVCKKLFYLFHFLTRPLVNLFLLGPSTSSHKKNNNGGDERL